MERAVSESVDIYTDYTGVADGDEAAWVLQWAVTEAQRVYTQRILILEGRNVQYFDW
jgi:hypothetical protein